MPVNDDLGRRMKENYEQISKTRLVRRMPVIIRIDGKAFHTFARNFKKPFDHILMESMQETMKYLCENIQGCVLGYTQSDEISLLLIDYKELNSGAWFDNEVQKMCSISASMATMIFNMLFGKKANNYIEYTFEARNISDNERKYADTLKKAVEKGAMFDARVFNIPKEEVTNYFYWRQLDATRNSIQMVGQANFSHKELHKKTCSDIQDMLHEQKEINWNDFSVPEKRGTCCRKEHYIPDGSIIPKSRWNTDVDIPIFKGEGRKYIDELVCVDEMYFLYLKRNENENR